MLLSDSDRERFFERLNRHAGAGTLDLAELERRVEAIVTASTREAALAVMADLPALADEAPSPPARARGRRGHGQSDQPDADWRPTAERFRDPRSNRVMRVYEDAAGGRHYVPDG
ncbi:MAG: DUF1707 SHOCT-like domain-containing protein [Solirubrobacteraceae bacterium]